MKAEIFLERENKKKTITFNKEDSIKTILKKLKINPSTIVVSVNNEIVTEDYILQDKDKVELLSVVSGG